MRVAILHEGYGNKSVDRVLLERLIEIQGLDKGQVEFYGMSSKSNFFNLHYKTYQELKPEIEADQIAKVLFVVDADFQSDDQSCGGYENSLKALGEIASDLKISSISQFYICCDPNTKEGNIESLLLSTLDEEKKACISDFLACSDFAAKENAKAILNQIYIRAYPEAPYDFEHVHFDELKGKLVALLS